METFKNAFTDRKNPFPWGKAFCAGLAASLPIVIGLLLGNFHYGIAAGMGGFTYLYVFNQPYAQRAKLIFSVAVGLAMSMFLGIVLSPYPLGVAIGMGTIGAIGTFVFGALRITGPSAIFFVLCFSIATGIPIDPADAPLRGGLVLLGGVLAWLISMLGWFFNPHGPETTAVKKVYDQLAAFADSAGGEEMNNARHKTVAVLKEAEEVLLAGYSRWTETDSFKRLYLLNDHANRLFIAILELAEKRRNGFPPELGKSLRALAKTIGSTNKNEEKILQPETDDVKIADLFREIYDADAIVNEPAGKIQRNVKMARPSLRSKLLGAFDKNSIVFLTAARFGIILMAASMIAYVFPFERSYWVPLSCASVMLGSTIISTFHRAIQRTIGTLVGLLIAGLLLMNIHNGFVVALLILSLSFLTELFIVRNYALAVLFITPSALIIAEYSTEIHNFHFFAAARATDIIAGSIIGLLGVLLFGRRTASGMLNHYIVKTLRSQGQYVLALFSDNNGKMEFNESRERRKMHTNLVNLSTVYTTALGELSGNKKKVESFWPVIFSIEQLGFYLDAALKYEKRPVLNDEELSGLLYIFETMARAVEQNRPPTERAVPELPGFKKIRNEIIDLQVSLRFGESR
ncbi:FUSC family protein [Bacillus sp. FJAT-27245]|uniref:FUSC family protein n=1 Tax=Bacillus sp. FJAT-27245 TaxID=1684144 RepID=UPI001E4F9EDE|nr:FUSC family protein [Bacillus sp. FJAT-27245]